MAEVKLRSKQLNSLKRIIEDALTERLRGLQEGIKRTQERIRLYLADGRLLHIRDIK